MVDHAIAVVEFAFPPARIVDLVMNKGKSSKLSNRLAMAIGKGVDKTKNAGAVDQQYTLLTLVFYMDSLSEFLGI